METPKNTSLPLTAEEIAELIEATAEEDARLLWANVPRQYETMRRLESRGDTYFETRKSPVKK